MVEDLERVCASAVGEGVSAAALMGRDGQPVAVAGTLSATDLHALAGLVTQSLKGDALASSLFAGESFDVTLDHRMASIRVAARCVFVVVISRAMTPSALARAAELHFQTEQIVGGIPFAPPSGSSGAGSAGPAALPVIELGVTPGVKPRN